MRRKPVAFIAFRSSKTRCYFRFAIQSRKDKLYRFLFPQESVDRTQCRHNCPRNFKTKSVPKSVPKSVETGWNYRTGVTGRQNAKHPELKPKSDYSSPIGDLVPQSVIHRFDHLINK
jgi:hypothetical protein